MNSKLFEDRFRLTALVLLLIAFVMSLIASISLPSCASMYVARTQFAPGTTTRTRPASGDDATPIIEGPAIENNDGSVRYEYPPSREIRLGVWTSCFYSEERYTGDRYCPHVGYGYSLTVWDAERNTERKLQSALSSGLIVAPIATAFIGFSLVVALFFVLGVQPRLARFLNGSIAVASFTAGLGFVLDVALVVGLKSIFNLPGATTSPGAGTWVTLISFVFATSAAVLLFIGQRKISRTQKSKSSVSDDALDKIIAHTNS